MPRRTFAVCCLCTLLLFLFVIFFFNDTPTTEIYTLSLHDALPICYSTAEGPVVEGERMQVGLITIQRGTRMRRSEEHTSELQSLRHLVCRLLLEKKKKTPKHKREQETTPEN